MSRSACAALPIEATGSSTQSCQMLAAQAAAIAGPRRRQPLVPSSHGHAGTPQFLLQLVGKALGGEIGGGHARNLIHRSSFLDKGS